MAPSQLGTWPVSVEIPVAWGDMDAYGHVNNSIYFRWFETARIAYFARIGVLDRMERDHIGPILARTTCDYRSAVRYPDHLTVQATISHLGNTSFVMGYRVISQEHNGIAAEGEGVIVLLDYTTRQKVSLDPDLRKAIEALEAAGV